MKVFSRKMLAVVSASILFSAAPGVAVAQSSFSGSSASDQNQTVVQDTSSADAGEDPAEGIEAQGGTDEYPTPILPEWAENHRLKT